MILGANDVLLMIGDSITDCERSRPEIDGVEPSLGAGYVSMVAATLGRLYPERAIRVINKGNSGDTTRQLKARWQRDVLDIAPDWLSIKIGINDVWRTFDQPDDPSAGVGIDEYRANLDQLIVSAKPVVAKGVILMTPYFIEPDRSEPMRAMMDQFGRVVRELADRHEALLVDTQAPFDEELLDKEGKKHHPMHFCADRVHPNPRGHYLIARAFLAAVGAAVPDELNLWSRT
ncbi:MAG: SGNH/GDSL hydrolase family protein [Phycisphaerae bacterium]|nr:SGNH/GDSL hydrolase family protein [Phycisphaerae bacterium]